MDIKALSLVVEELKAERDTLTAAITCLQDRMTREINRQTAERREPAAVAPKVARTAPAERKTPAKPFSKSGLLPVDDAILAAIRELGPSGAIEVTDKVCELRPNSHRPTIQTRIAYLMRERVIHKGDDFKLRPVDNFVVSGL